MSLGKHLINATTADGLDSIESIVEASRPQQEVARIKLNGARADRLSAEAERQRKASEAEAEDKCRTSSCWVDASTGLMWTRRDNGSDIGWNQAVAYCRNLNVGGLRNWRLPEIGELMGIYEPSQKGARGSVHLTGAYVWSATKGPGQGDSMALNFNFGERGSWPVYDTDLRALCVRRSGE